MTRIFIENYELDLTAEISHQLTFSIDDIRNLDSKTTSFSKTIIIPGSQRNNKIFGNIYELSNANFPNGQVNAFYDFDASRSAQARIEINGLQAMKGTMRLLSITVDKGSIEYEVALFGELGGFMSAVGVKKLEDIDFSKYNHQWNYDNIVATWQDQGEYNITTNYAIAGPFSTEKYDVVYRIRIYDANASAIQPFDKIRVTGSSSNDGVYTVAQVQWFPSAVRTDIYVFEALTGESGSTINIKVLDADGYGYVYPLIDYGVSDPSGALGLHPLSWDFKTFRPAFFVLEYLDNIITGAGYTWESNFLKSNFFRSLIIPNNDIGLEKRGATDYLQLSGTTYALDLHDHTTPITADIPFNTTVTTNGFSVNGAKTIFTYTNAGSVTAKIKIDFNGSLNKPRYSVFRFVLLVNGESAAEFVLPNPYDPYADVISGSLEKIMSFTTGDKVEFAYYYYSGTYSVYHSGNGVQPGYWEQVPVTEHTLVNLNIFNIQIINDPPGFIKYTYDEELEMNNIIPKNVYQKDFFTSIMKMFNLMVVERKDKNKHLVIEPYVDFYNTDRATYQDWSYKVNREKPMIIKPMSEISSRLYEFKFKDDSDYYNEDYKKRFNQTYGNRTFDNQLEFAKDSSSVEVIFSPAVLVGYQDEDKVFPAIYKKEGELRVPMAHNIRIMQIKRIADVEEFQIRNGSPTSAGTLLGSPISYLYAGHLNNPDAPTIDINWGATKQLYFALAAGSLQYNGFNNFYSPYMAEIIDKDSRLVTCEMKLTESDIFNLDFSRFVMVDGVLFRLVKIYDWSEGALTKVDLLRVINTTYQPVFGYFKITYPPNIGQVTIDISGVTYTWDDVEFWNYAFNLPTNGTPITKVINMNNTDFYFFGGNNINLYVAGSSITSIEDYGNCITSVLSGGFAECGILTNIYLPAATSLGSSSGDNTVFDAISGNTIKATFNKALQTNNAGNPDGDIQYLTSNNTVTINYI